LAAGARGGGESSKEKKDGNAPTIEMGGLQHFLEKAAGCGGEPGKFLDHLSKRGVEPGWVANEKKHNTSNLWEGWENRPIKEKSPNQFARPKNSTVDPTTYLRANKKKKQNR